MNSLHNFDRSLDKFLAWLSEAESSLESVEVDAERATSSSSRHPESALPHHQLKVGSSIYFLDNPNLNYALLF